MKNEVRSDECGMRNLRSRLAMREQIQHSALRIPQLSKSKTRINSLKLAWRRLGSFGAGENLIFCKERWSLAMERKHIAKKTNLKKRTQAFCKNANDSVVFCHGRQQGTQANR